MATQKDTELTYCYTHTTFTSKYRIPTEELRANEQLQAEQITEGPHREGKETNITTMGIPPLTWRPAVGNNYH